MLLINSVNAQYCLPTYTNGCEFGDGLTQFQLNTIDQTVLCTGSPSYYQDYTSLSTDLAELGYYTLNVQSNNSGLYVTVWIDYDNNGAFDNSTELISQFYYYNVGFYDGFTFQVPGGLTTGPTRLRIMSCTMGGYPSDACNSGGYGNCCDFTVNITSPVSAPFVTTLPASSIHGTYATMNGSVNANGNLTHVQFYYGLDSTYGNIVGATPSAVSGSTDTDVLAIASGLEPNTTYHYMVVGFGAGGFVQGTDMTFTTSQLSPSVITLGADLISGVSARLNGLVNANNDVSSASFEYGLDLSYGLTVTGNPIPVTGYYNQSISASLTGLAMNTTYHYRIVSTNSSGTSYGDDMSFTTLSTPFCLPVYSSGCSGVPSVITSIELNTLSQAIPCSGSPSYYQDFTSLSTDLTMNASYSINVTAGNDGTAVTVWIDYNQNNIFDGYAEVATYIYCPNAGVPSSGYFTVPVSSNFGPARIRAMSCDYTTTGNYLFDPCSTSEIYGNCVDFMVNLLPPPPPPIVTTLAADGVTGTDATLHGIVNANGTSTDVSFDYGPTDSYGWWAPGSPSPVSGSSDTPVSSSISGLSGNATYHYRVVGSSIGGMTLGDDITFTTNAIAPTVYTEMATGIIGNNASLRGSVNANNLSTTVSFEYGLTTSYGTVVTASPSILTDGNLTSVSADLTGLVLSTEYHYRVVATNSVGTSYGDDMTFTSSSTMYCIPTFNYGCYYYNIGVTYFGLNTISQTIGCTGIPGDPTFYQNFSSTSTDIAQNTPYTISVRSGYGAGCYYPTAVCVWIDYNHNNVFDGPSELVGQVQCCYVGTTYTIPLTVPATSMTGPTTIRVLAAYQNYPTDPCGFNFYGNCSDFSVNIIPPITPPSVTTNSASGITSNAAVLNGTVNANGTSSSTGFDWGLTSSYGNTVAGVPASVTGSSDIPFSASLASLASSTIYHYRAWAMNPGGTTYGSDMAFTTNAPPANCYHNQCNKHRRGYSNT